MLAHFRQRLAVSILSLVAEASVMGERYRTRPRANDNMRERRPSGQTATLYEVNDGQRREAGTQPEWCEAISTCHGSLRVEPTKSVTRKRA